MHYLQRLLFSVLTISMFLAILPASAMDQSSASATPNTVSSLRRSYSSLSMIKLKPATPPTELLQQMSSLDLTDLSMDEISISSFLSIILQESLSSVDEKFTENQTCIYLNPTWQLDKTSNYICLITAEGLSIMIPKSYISTSKFFAQFELEETPRRGCFSCLKKRKPKVLRFTSFITEKNKHLFSNKVLLSIFFLLKYITEELEDNSREQVVLATIKKIEQAYEALLSAGYNPTQLLRDCIALARLLDIELIHVPLEHVAHNYQIYLEIL